MQKLWGCQQNYVSQWKKINMSHKNKFAKPIDLVTKSLRNWVPLQYPDRS